VSEQRYIVIGRILGSRGNRGEVCVESLSDYPRRFHELERCFIQTGSEGYRRYEIECIRFIKGRPVVKLVGVDDIGRAKQFAGLDICIPVEEAVKPGPDEYFLHDLLSLEVYTENGEFLGRLTGCYHTGANDVYEVKRGPEEVLVPALKDVVQVIDLAERRMVVRLPEGLR